LRARGSRATRSHFYIAEGLIPPPKKKRRNMAWYGIEHLERLNAIKTLQEERFCR
jgi:DNA-binding transcriptional MerR regulator